MLVCKAVKPVVDRRHEGVFLWSLYIIPCWEGGAPQGPLATNLAYEIPGITEEEEGDFILYRLWQPVGKKLVFEDLLWC